MDFIPSVVGNYQRVCRRGFTFEIPIDAMNKKKKLSRDDKQAVDYKSISGERLELQVIWEPSI